MDDPVTDITFVSDVAHCPKGYTLVSECPCGHDAQLWEKVLGGVDATRYLCFTKDNDANEIIEDMYIPSAGSRYLYKGFEVIPKTVEGDTPLRHKQLAIKKVSRKTATKAVADVIVCRSRDKVSKMYKQSDKVNGLRICHRTVNYKYTPPRRATMSNSSDLNQRFESLSVYEQQPSRMRSGSDSTTKKQNSPPPTIPLDGYVPKINDPPTAPPRASDTSGHPVDLYNYTPSPDLSAGSRKPVKEEVVQVATVQTLGSAPYPSDTTATSEVDAGSIPSTAPSAPTTVSQPNDLPAISSYPSTNPFSQSQPTTVGLQQGYPSSANPTNTYPQQHYPPAAPAQEYRQQNPSSGSYPYNPMQTAPTSNYYQTSSYPPPPPNLGPYGYSAGGAPSGGYPPQQPGPYDYSSVAGSSFAQASYNPYQSHNSNSAPYNPYQHQRPYPASASQSGTLGTNAPYPLRIPTTTATTTNNSSSYGFKF